jgi:nitrite reductase/ring-hydroxylating ferredoxin subunit
MVGRISSLRENQPKILTGKSALGMSENFIVALSNGKVSAHSVRCTHAGCAISEIGPVSDTVECLCHGSIFDGVSGAVLKGPAQIPLTAYNVATVGDEIYIEVG